MLIRYSVSYIEGSQRTALLKSTIVRLIEYCGMSQCGTICNNFGNGEAVLKDVLVAEKVGPGDMLMSFTRLSTTFAIYDCYNS